MKLFVLCGKAGSGKTTLGGYLKEELAIAGYQPCLMHLTQPLYTYARQYFDWDPDKDEKPREFLQHMGIDVIQKHLGKHDFLMNRLCEDIEILSMFFDSFIITDARLVNEFIEFRKRFSDVTLIHVVRNHYDDGLTEEQRKHITETDIDDYNSFDYTIMNSSIDELHDFAKEVVRRTTRGGEVDE